MRFAQAMSNVVEFGYQYFSYRFLSLRMNSRPPNIWEQLKFRNRSGRHTLSQTISQSNYSFFIGTLNWQPCNARHCGIDVCTASLSFSLFFSSARIAKVTHMLAVVPVCDHSHPNNWTWSLSAIFLNIDLSMFPKTNNHCHLLLFRCCIVFMLLFTSTSQTLLFQVKI